MSNNTINIRPGVGYLSILSAINYTPYMQQQSLWTILFKVIDNKLKLEDFTVIINLKLILLSTQQQLK